jgi:hypothetical protein
MTELIIRLKNNRSVCEICEAISATVVPALILMLPVFIIYAAS